MKKNKCPICDGLLQSKCGDVTFPIAKDREIKVKKIDYLQCASCSEKIFSHDAQVKIEKAAYGVRKGAA